MRQGHHPGMILQQVGGEIADIGVEMAGIQGRHRRGVIDDTVAGEVEQHPALAHVAQALGADHAAGLVRQRDVEADEVRPGDQVVHAQGLLDVGGQLPGALDGDGRVIADDLHPQGAGDVGHLDADRPQAHHAQGAARQLEANKLLLARLHRLADGGVVPLQAPGEGPALGDVARRQQHARHHQLLDGIGVGPGGVEHRDAALGHARHGDVVDPGPRPAYRPQGGGDLQVVHAGGTHQDGVGMGDLGGDLVLLAGEAVQARNRDIVQRQYLVHAF